MLSETWSFDRSTATTALSAVKNCRGVVVMSLVSGLLCLLLEGYASDNRHLLRGRRRVLAPESGRLLAQNVFRAYLLGCYCLTKFRLGR
jgi:hypothetical protein